MSQWWRDVVINTFLSVNEVALHRARLAYYLDRSTRHSLPPRMVIEYQPVRLDLGRVCSLVRLASDNPMPC